MPRFHTHRGIKSVLWPPERSLLTDLNIFETTYGKNWSGQGLLISLNREMVSM